MGVKPNIVYIFADQLRAQALGYAGDPNVHTPYIDRLAGGCLNFTNAVSTCPICTPYRACLLTGQYPLTHGLFMNDLCLPDNGHSLGQELKTAGYNTSWIGKWHLDGHGRKSYIPPERRQGFDYWKVLECTHDYNNSQYYSGDNDQPLTWENYDTYAQTDDAVNYLKSRDNNPFAMFLSFGTPHDPYDTAPEDLKALYPAKKLKLRQNVAEHRQNQALEQLPGYYAHVTAIDKCVQKIDETLQELNLQENTIFIFTSDHGDLLESQWHSGNPVRGSRKQMPYDESVLVPLLLRYPDKYGRTGRRITHPLGSPDIMPTLLSLAGITIPETVEGRDLTPTIDKDSEATDGVLIANYHPFSDWRTERGGKAYRGIRTARYTFVRDLNGPWLLFDNQQDPFQLENKVNRIGYSETQSQLDFELKELLRKYNDNFESPEVLRDNWGYEIDDMEEIPFGN